MHAGAGERHASGGGATAGAAAERPEEPWAVPGADLVHRACRRRRHRPRNGADLWSVAAGMAKATATVTAAVERSKEAAAAAAATAALLRADRPGQQLA